MPIRILILTLFGASVALDVGLMIARFDWFCVPALLLGWFLADAASGLVHLLMDYVPCPRGLGLVDIYTYPGSRESADYLALRREVMARLTPFQKIAFDFKTHHPRPDALGRRGFWQQVGTTVILAALPASLALNLAAWNFALPGWVIATALTLIIGSALAQHFHGSLHHPRPPLHIRALRRVGLLMQPAAHQRHHDSLQRDFATNCGWSNPLINPLFRWLRARGLLNDSGLEPAA